jgi:hypothetical protein
MYSVRIVPERIAAGNAELRTLVDGVTAQLGLPQ